MPVSPTYCALCLHLLHSSSSAGDPVLHTVAGSICWERSGNKRPGPSQAQGLLGNGFWQQHRDFGAS